MSHILDGYRRYQQQIIPCNVQFHEFFYDYDDPESMCPILKRISQDDPAHFDGIALWGNTTSGKVVAMLNRLQGKGVPVVMLERAPADPELYDCCGRTNSPLPRFQICWGLVLFTTFVGFSSNKQDDPLLNTLKTPKISKAITNRDKLLTNKSTPQLPSRITYNVCSTLIRV